MKCRYRECDERARAGWTTCSRHYSAGTSRVHFERQQREREARVRRLQRQADDRERAEVAAAEARIRELKR